LLNNSYTWGTPTATCPKQFSWSEAFHVPLTKVSDEACYGEFTSLREVMTEFAAAMSKLARLLAGVLTENLGHGKEVIDNICDESTCFLRLNHYPACPISPEISGLAWSNDVYKSVEHKVVTNAKMERYSIAYFLCPSFDSSIGSFREPSVYRKFTFREYRDQVQEDVRKTGYKVGLPRFLLKGTEDFTRSNKESNTRLYIPSITANS
ncbi:Oxoglutarate/iron-dependent dioxygenase - like 10, partial [Theobroma cacao]